MSKLTSILLVASCALSLSPYLPAETPGGSRTAPTRISQAIDGSRLIPLTGNVRGDLARYPDLGLVEDGLTLKLYVVLRRSAEQETALDNLVARQQQPTAEEYHKWLTPEQFGERFGVSELDIAKIAAWLEGQGLRVNGVMNNASVLTVTATAGDVSRVFHTQLHSFEVRGGRYPALVADPQIPEALAGMVAGIVGLNKIPPRDKHTPIHQASFDPATHSWHNYDTVSVKPKDNAGGGEFDETPQDFYVIYNVNKLYSAGITGAGRTIAVPEPTDIEYGTVNSSTGQATGGDVATFRKVFGVAGTLNMVVMHGYGTGAAACNDPGVTDTGSVGEATLDAEWSNALAPAAKLIFMSCDSNPDNGVDSSILALIDGNLADVIGLSWGFSELNADSATFSAHDAEFKQAATQGQTIFVAAGDAGSDTNDQDTSIAATSGLNIDAYADNPLVTAAGALDFSDYYDAGLSGPPQSNYWGTTNSTFFETAKGYVPETTWNGSCASSLLANFQAMTPAAYCGSLTSSSPYVDGAVVGGAGGYSTHYALPTWQSGITGLSASATKRAIPDISLFGSNGVWSHAIVSCDSQSSTSNCSSLSAFGAAGGTSFVAPQLTGIAALLVQYTGERQGLWNPALYALAKAQFTTAATKTGCYSNGQTANDGVTKSLPGSACVFNDVTTSNNDVPCAKGSLDCFVNSGDSNGLLSTTGASSLNIAYNSGPGYDLATGIGSINVYNLFANWNKAFTSTTKLAASVSTIASTASVKLTATVAGGTPVGYASEVPALGGTVAFDLGATVLGSCALSADTCAVTVAGTALKVGANSITATYAGSKTYPGSTSSIVSVTVAGASPVITLTPATLTFPNTVAGVTSDAQLVTVKNTGTGAATISSFAISGTAPTSFVELNDCGASLAAGASCMVSVAFRPASAAALTATLNVADNASGSPQKVTLSGTGTAKPSVKLSATTLTFASTVEKTTSAYQTVTLTNAGTSILDLTSIAIAGTNATSFTELNTCGATLAPAANCVVYVSFTPTTTGALTGTLTITDTGNASPQTVVLKGTGAA